MREKKKGLFEENFGRIHVQVNLKKNNDVYAEDIKKILVEFFKKHCQISEDYKYMLHPYYNVHLFITIPCVHCSLINTKNCHPLLINRKEMINTHQ